MTVALACAVVALYAAAAVTLAVLVCRLADANPEASEDDGCAIDADLDTHLWGAQ